MTTRFEPNRRLLEILVGSKLYGEPSAAIRELIQNAWDAIQWRIRHGDGRGGRIDVRFSVENAWFEIIDDGFGMDQEAIEGSFLQIGQDKLDALHQEDREGQIGHFGIGVLSIFLVAERFEVTTRHLYAQDKGIHFDVTGINDAIEFSASVDGLVGTRIRVYPRSDDTFSIREIPKMVRKYVRHVDGVYIHFVDDDTSEALPKTWTEAELHGVRELEGLTGVRAGRLGFTSALRQQAGTLSSDLTICNSGFLAEEDVHDLIPTPAIGLSGEIDLEPQTITIGLSRERFQRDLRWMQLGNRLQQWAIAVALAELKHGELTPQLHALDSSETKRNLLLWYHFIPPEPPFSELYEVIEKRLFETIPFKLPERRPRSLAQILESKMQGAKLFFKQVWQPNEETRSIDDEDVPISIRQEIRDSIRVGALRAKGFEVVELDRLQVNLRRGGTVRTYNVDEYPLVLRCLEKRGYQLIDIASASESDMDLRSIERLPMLRDALLSTGGLRFADVSESKRRIIIDRSGTKYINLRHPEVQNLLAVIPAAVSNPLKKRLLETYLKIEDFSLREARRILVELLQSDDLEVMAELDVAPLTREYIASQIKQLLAELGE